MFWFQSGAKLSGHACLQLQDVGLGIGQWWVSLGTNLGCVFKKKTKENKNLMTITWTWKGSTHSKRSNFLRLYLLQKVWKLKNNFLFLMRLFIYFYVSEYFACMYISALHECRAHQAPKRALASRELDLQVVMKHGGDAGLRASGRAAHALHHRAISRAPWSPY